MRFTNTLSGRTKRASVDVALIDRSGNTEKTLGFTRNKNLDKAGNIGRCEGKIINRQKGFRHKSYK